MRLVEVVIDVPAARRLDAERAAYAIGAQGLEIRDVDTGAPRGRVHVVLWIPAQQRAATVAALRSIDATITTHAVDADWVDTAPVQMGPLVIHGIERAVGFGDGAHPTTLLCMQALQKTKLSSVLDVGTGTGILAIAAAKLGASRVVATDIDPLARAAARKAIRANDVDVRVQAALPGGQFDLVIANLYRDVLIELAPALLARASRELIISGFTDVRAIEAAFAGARVTERARRAGWRLFRITPPPHARPPATGARR